MRRNSYDISKAFFRLGMWEFDSFEVSHPFRYSGRALWDRQENPPMAGFCVLERVSTFPLGTLGRLNCQKSPPNAANIRILERPRPETWFDHYCRLSLPVYGALIVPMLKHKLAQEKIIGG